MIPTSRKNQLLEEARTCIVEEGRDTRECIVEIAKRNNFSKEDLLEFRDMLSEEED
jgi:predicted house-cleaning noncanonical NTP pyrophosphatase (MazG superfamily)